MNGVGVQVVRSLLTAKLKGQLAVARDLGAGDDLLNWITDAIEALIESTGRKYIWTEFGLRVF